MTKDDIIHMAETCGIPEFEYNESQAENILLFAELIVRECIRYFNEDYQRDFNTLWREDLTKGIKQHFGVE